MEHDQYASTLGLGKDAVLVKQVKERRPSANEPSSEAAPGSASEWTAAIVQASFLHCFGVLLFSLSACRLS